MSQDENVFRVGLCLAGAVSAGAYTAGVIDALIEALDDWEKRRNMKGTPSHRVEIPVIGGASAGGMTAIITAAALHTELKYVKEPGSDLLAERPENHLYHSWVDLTGSDMISAMLDTTDIEREGVISLLNSDFIDQIAARAIQVQMASHRHPYFSESLKLFTTLSSLNGLEYNVAFNTSDPENARYHMKIHNDYACFQLSPASKEIVSGMEKEGNFNKGWMPLNFYKGLNADLARDAAMATGAFPLGLRSRFVKRKSGYVNALDWLSQATATMKLKDPEYLTLNVDGGLINNEPFIKISDVLGELTQQDADDRQYFARFRSTVLMVDPFPSVQSEVYTPKQHLLRVAGSTFSAMMNQMRAKPRHLRDAMAEDCAGQFLIAPSREIQHEDGSIEKVAGERAIACGVLDGFGGFLSKEFRIHDYFLGRFNCKRFLRDYFTIPEKDIATNPIFRHGYQGLNLDQFRSRSDKQKIQIIPMFSTEQEYLFPQIKFSSGGTWPQIELRKIQAYEKAIKKRIQKILLNTAELNKFNQFLLWGGAKVLLNRTLTNSVMGAIEKSLKKWDLVKER